MSMPSTQYDYFKGNKRILIAGGKDGSKVFLLFLNTFFELGRKGYLAGEAKADYEKYINRATPMDTPATTPEVSSTDGAPA